MTALEKFLANFDDSFDLSKVLDPQVEIIESVRYPKAHIYKYYSSARDSFFNRPQVRFSPRDALNDPFEMSRKWKDFSTIEIREHIKKRLYRTLPEVFSNSNLLVEMFVEERAASGAPLSTAEIDTIRVILTSDQGKAFISNQLTVASQLIEPAVEYIFNKIEGEFQTIVDETISKSGVLSLSEDHLSDLMWAHYGESGRGFVVGLRVAHDFFQASNATTNSNSPLKKVIYTDKWVQNFWKNPYYLFLVKATRWSYEKEWRIFKRFSSSDETMGARGNATHLWNLSPDLIASVHFGYNCADSDIEKYIGALRSFGANPLFCKIKPNRETGYLEEHHLL